MQALAIHGGTPVRQHPFSAWPVYGEPEREALLRVLESGNWGGYPSPNREAAAFAREFATRHDANWGVCAANGTVTLLLALRAAGVSRGAEVIVPPYTFAATAAAAMYAGAVPVFADVKASDLTLDPEAVEAAINERTAAVICVHLASAVADLDRLRAICDARGLVLIEDCAHAHGAKWSGRGVGSIGALGSFSFQSSKLMTAGEGGIVTTNNRELEKRVQSLVNCGRAEGAYSDIEPWLGYNFRITEFQAALLRAQLGRLSEQNRARAQGFDYLEAELPRIEGVSCLEVDSRVTERAGYQFVFRIHPEAFSKKPKARILAALTAEGIPADEGYEPLNRRHALLPANTLEQWYDAGARRPDLVGTPCPVTERGWEETIWLGHEIFLGPRSDLDDVLEAVAKVQRHAAEL